MIHCLQFWLALRFKHAQKLWCVCYILLYIWSVCVLRLRELSERARGDSGLHQHRHHLQMGLLPEPVWSRRYNTALIIDYWLIHDAEGDGQHLRVCWRAAHCQILTPELSNRWWLLLLCVSGCLKQELSALTRCCGWVTCFRNTQAWVNKDYYTAVWNN